ncbi:hypothetical protein CONLIGDRAFT_449793 [Coniochaeta ligniaria NRRL 30616]|uniref:Transmembrane protein n=1 Tax=Coniochaeta ligniaria NRRL 30616 TaxID=1408157 RepID=A0A1J7IJF6_9PEZI|nr:hypothetical protein CONLIGDRAFT_449793 [Coniochaeta ligniaria NRRL 30616]
MDRWMDRRMDGTFGLLGRFMEENGLPGVRVRLWNLLWWSCTIFFSWSSVHIALVPARAGVRRFEVISGQGKGPQKGSRRIKGVLEFWFVFKASKHFGRELVLFSSAWYREVGRAAVCFYHLASRRRRLTRLVLRYPVDIQGCLSSLV